VAKTIVRILMLLVVAGTIAGVAQDAGPKNAVADADRAFCQATRAKGLEGWVEWFADNAVMSQFDPPAIGKQGVRQAYTGMFQLKDLDFQWWPDKAEILPQGDMGYSSGHYTRSWTDAKGAKQTRTGNYITIWQKQKDGSWRVIGDYGTVNPPKK
jgi:ketosteroid isomerase-like protein